MGGSLPRALDVGGAGRQNFAFRQGRTVVGAPEKNAGPRAPAYIVTALNIKC